MDSLDKLGQWKAGIADLEWTPDPAASRALDRLADALGSARFPVRWYTLTFAEGTRGLSMMQGHPCEWDQLTVGSMIERSDGGWEALSNGNRIVARASTLEGLARKLRRIWAGR
jgi:hypothetical protein